MSRLILVSNRLPVTVKAEGTASVRVSPSMGGLATGLSRPHEKRGGLWLGWPGDISRLSPAQQTLVDERLAALRCVPLHLTVSEVNRFYEGFSNRVLWPVFHSLPESVPPESRHFSTYRRVNQRFADAVVKLWQPGDTIWIHDYQLLLVPGLVRKQLPHPRIGFFLHIPFPPSEVFRTLPWREELLSGLLGADLIGFHTPGFQRNFTEALSDLLPQSTVGDEIRAPDGRAVQVDAFPMGIDATWFESLAAEEAVQREAQSIRAGLREHGEKLILGIDRMDYTKGIPRRLLAMRRLLERRPDLRGRIRFVQVAVPSRENVEAYEALRREVDLLTGRINSQYGTLDRVPIHYLYKGCSVQQLAALYSAADVMLVTPLRDGMNLVAKEFAACRNDEDGVLVLSEFAGAAGSMSEALIVNPYDLDQVADAVGRALEMAPDERSRRMRALREDVRQTDVHWWVNTFLRQLEGTSTSTGADQTVQTILDRLQDAPQRVLMIDYDGTLVPLVQRPEMAAPDAELLELLRQLATQRGTSVHVVSGRPREVLEAWLGQLPIGLHAEHGLWSRITPEAPWQRLEGVSTTWMSKVRPVFDDFVARTPGSFVEQKSASLTWHFRQAGPEGELQANELRRYLAKLLADEGLADTLEVMPGNKVIEIRPHGVHKGRVVGTVLNSTPGHPLPVAFGDDRTDEDLFAALPPGSLAVHIGPTPSQAPLRIASPEALRSLLWTLVSENAGQAAVEREQETPLDRR